MAEQDGGPAFPHVAEGGPGSGVHPNVEFGMSLRDYFAARAMQAILTTMPQALQATAKSSGQKETQVAAGAAYEFADAMLAHRTQETK